MSINAILVFGFFFTVLPICLPYHAYLKKLAKKDPIKSWKKSKKLVGTFFGWELKVAGCKITVLGKDKIPDEPVLFVGNHRSYFDILVSHNSIDQPVGFIAKKEMEKFPFLNKYMKDIGCLFIDRDNIKQGLEIINKGTERIKNGHSMVLFPEGHRNQTDGLLPFKEGGYKMAEKAKCAIVPMVLTGTDNMMESNPHKKIKKGKVVIEFLDPIYPTEYAPKERKEIYKTFPDMFIAKRKEHLELLKTL